MTCPKSSQSTTRRPPVDSLAGGAPRCQHAERFRAGDLILVDHRGERPFKSPFQVTRRSHLFKMLAVVVFCSRVSSPSDLRTLCEKGSWDDDWDAQICTELRAEAVQGSQLDGLFLVEDVGRWVLGGLIKVHTQTCATCLVDGEVRKQGEEELGARWVLDGCQTRQITHLTHAPCT